MSKTLIVVLTLVIGLVLGFAVGSRMTSGVQGQSVPTDTFSAVPAAIGAEDVSGPYEVAEGWPKISARCPVTRSGHMAEQGASLPKARIASICSGAGNCQMSLVRRRHNCVILDRTSCSRLPGFRGATPTLQHRPARVGRVKIPRREWNSGGDHRHPIGNSVLTLAGNTA